VIALARSERSAAVAAALGLPCAALRGDTQHHALLTVAPASQRAHGDAPAGVAEVIPPSAAAAPGPVGAPLIRLLTVEPIRPLLGRARLGSPTRHLVRRLNRPLVVCPRDPRTAMRVREAPSPTWSIL
jgi:hypothetical protein